MKENTISSAVTFEFKLLETRELPLAFNSTAFLYKHVKTGARLVHLENTDKINGFFTVFNTIPFDNTGIMHILEHSVLAGSKNYKVKDPFFSLLKGGLTEFCNAFTGSDWTGYPFCAREEGYFKTLGVYLDSMFLPTLSEDTFRQEAHRFAFDEKENLVIKGVVYEEMKGAFSSLDGLIERKCLCDLFPDNAYGCSSGGDPEFIPDLTLENLRSAHQKFYHPSNSTTVTYGSVPVESVLEFMDGYLSQFDKQKLDISELIGNQVWWKKPKNISVSYPIDKKEPAEDKYAVIVTLRGPDTLNSTEVLAMKILERILLGHDGAILKKALIDSGLGKRIVGIGYEPDMKETLFMVGLDGTKIGKENDVAKIIFSVFKELSEKGIDKKEVASAVYQMSIDIKSIGNGPFGSPFFMKVVFNSLGDIIYGNNDELINSLDARIILSELEKMKDGTLLKKVLDTYLFKNTHYIVTIFEPDKELSEKREAQFERKMAEIKNTMAPKRIAEIKDMNINLEKKQSAPDDPKALAVFPKLTLKEMPNCPDEFDTKTIVFNNVDILNTPTGTNGQTYCTFGLGVNNLKPELVPFLPLFTKAWKGMGIIDVDYIEMSKRINALGNMGLYPEVYCHTKKGKNFANLVLEFSVSSPVEKFAELMEILREKINNFDPTNVKRLKQILDNLESGLANQVVSSGHLFAICNAKNGLSARANLDEKLSGLEQLSFLRKLQKEFAENPGKTVDKMVQIKNFMQVAYDSALFSIVSDDSNAKTTVLRFLVKQELDLDRRANNHGKMWCTESDVNPKKTRNFGYPLSPDSSFVAKSFGVFGIDSFALRVLSLALKRGALHTKIREQGGAYGAFCSFESIDGIWGFVSYRDPNIARTLQVYDEIFDYVSKSMVLSENELAKKIINTLNQYNPSIYPNMVSSTVFTRCLMGLTPQYRQMIWNGIKGVSASRLKEAAGLLKEQMVNANISVISSRQNIMKENEMISNSLEIVDI